MRIHGLHHVMLVASDAQSTTDFYADVLGLRLVRKAAVRDGSSGSHLYFGDEAVSPGSLLVFGEQPDAELGLPGVGGTHHIALRVAGRDELLRWKRRLNDLGHRVRGPFDRQYFTSIYFRGPDGEIIELATAGPGLGVDEPSAHGEVRPPRELTRAERDPEAVAAETWAHPVPEITPAMRLKHGLHHISATSSDVERTHDFLGGVLGLPLVKRTFNYDEPDMAHWYWGFSDDPRGSLVTYFGVDPDRVRRARPGRGQTHHYALAVRDAEELYQWRGRLLEAGLPVSEVRDHRYFRSIRTRDPDGHLVELATHGPGFDVDDEPVHKLHAADGQRTE